MDEINNIEENDAMDDSSEAQIIAWRTLINLVKPNFILYQKNVKGYCKKTDKMLMWDKYWGIINTANNW